MKVYLILIIILTSITFLLFFATSTDEGCKCQGIDFGLCIGTALCDEPHSDCIPLTCENKFELLGEVNTSKDSSLIYTLVIIDASKSMEGENLEATKRGSEEFIQQISEREYLAIIEFNEEAHILSNFSNDKITLFNSIELINPRGRTKFLEPLTLANELFSTAPKNVRKYILFLSDGAPEDKEGFFLEQVELLKEKNVNIFAVAFADKSNEKIMKQIASKDENLFLVSTAKDIEEKFVEAFTTILEEGDLELQQREEKGIYRKQEQLELELFSLHNNENILFNTDFCPLESTHYIEAKKGGKFSRILGNTIGSVIKFPLENLNSGAYEVIAHSKIFLDECTISTTKQIGDIQIIEEEYCNIACETIDFAMTNGKNTSYAANRSRTSWIILVDKSSSMNQGNHLSKAKENLKSLLTYMPATDKVIVGSFDNNVDILQNFGSAQEVSQTTFDRLIPSASTSLSFALAKAVELEKIAPTNTVHTIIISDGKYGEREIHSINQSLQELKGCISSINYGTHLLSTTEKAVELLKENRNCGKDFITKPSREDILDLLESYPIREPELVIELQKQQVGNQTQYFVNTISSFTGREIVATNENCAVSPLIRINITDETGRKKTGRQFLTDINESFIIEAGFENQECNYQTRQEVKFKQTEQNDSILLIVAIVALVLAINMLVFIYVLSRRIKKLKRIR